MSQQLPKNRRYEHPCSFSYKNSDTTLVVLCPFQIQVERASGRSNGIPMSSKVSKMKFEQEVCDNCIVIRPEVSRLDASVAPVFREIVIAEATENRSLIVVDLINVDFMDSSGLGAVIGCYKAVQETGGLALCSVHKNVKEVFALTHMDRIFEIHNDVSAYNNSKAA